MADTEHAAQHEIGPMLGRHATSAKKAVVTPGNARVFYNLAVAILIGFMLYIGRSILIPLIAAVFLSFLIFTVKENFRRIPLIGKFIPNWLGYILAFAGIFSIIFLFVEIIKSNVEQLVDFAPAYRARLEEVADQAIAYIRSLTFLPSDFLGNTLDRLRSQALSMIQPLASGFAGSARSLVTGSVVIFLYTVFILVERGRIFKKVALLTTDEERRRAIDETIGDIGALVRQYITVKTITNLITAGISYALMIFIGVDFAGFWALMIFALNYIPMFGAASAITLPVLWALIQPDGGGPQMMIKTLVLLIGTEQIMSNGIEPRIVGKSLNLSPLVILISLAFWGSMWGFAGFLLSVPMTVSLMLILTQFRSTRPIAIMLSDEGEIAPLKHPELGG